MATYPNPAIQSQYNRYQSRGLVGQLARPENNTYYYDVATAGVELKPGYGVYLDTVGGSPTVGNWILPADDTAPNANLVTHVVSFEQTNLNTPLAAVVGNANSEVVFPADTPAVKALANGAIYVTAGEDVLRGQALQFNVTTFTYGLISDATTAKVAFIALADAPTGEIVPVRVNRISAA